MRGQAAVPLVIPTDNVQLLDAVGATRIALGRLRVTWAFYLHFYGLTHDERPWRTRRWHLLHQARRNDTVMHLGRLRQVEGLRHLV